MFAADPCAVLTAKATAYLNRQTAEWPTALLREAIADPAAREATRRIDAAALAGDVQACTQACRSFWKAVLAHKPVPAEVAS